MLIFAAAFGRLCVETPVSSAKSSAQSQPPSGGCVLKLANLVSASLRVSQPPSGGCVLKQARNYTTTPKTEQPPSGGCALKQNLINLNSIIFTFLLYLSTQFIPNNISPLYFPLIRSRLCPIFSFHDLQLCVFLTFILTYQMS